jgi:MoxR-like ATPase
VRAALALIRAAKTYAASDARHYVVPDDVKALAGPVLAHRLVLDPEAEFDGVTALGVVSRILLDVPPPGDSAAA